MKKLCDKKKKIIKGILIKIGVLKNNFLVTFSIIRKSNNPLFCTICKCGTYIPLKAFCIWKYTYIRYVPFIKCIPARSFLTFLNFSSYKKYLSAESSNTIFSSAKCIILNSIPRLLIKYLRMMVKSNTISRYRQEYFTHFIEVSSRCNISNWLVLSISCLYFIRFLFFSDSFEIRAKILDIPYTTLSSVLRFVQILSFFFFAQFLNNSLCLFVHSISNREYILPFPLIRNIYSWNVTLGIAVIFAKRRFCAN